MREHDKLMGRMFSHMCGSPWLPLSLVSTLAWYLSFVLPAFVRRAVSGHTQAQTGQPDQQLNSNTEEFELQLWSKLAKTWSTPLPLTRSLALRL